MNRFDPATGEWNDSLAVDATARLETGDRVRVDGSRGRVEVLERARG